MTFKVKAVIFDRDGVIINTEGVVLASIKQAFARLGFTFTDDDIPHIIGRSSRVYKDYFLEKWDFDFEEYSKIQRSIFYENIDSAPYFTEALNLIKFLHEQNIPLGLTTSAGREGTDLILKRAGVREMFNVIVTREDCKELKPEPEPYLLTARKLQIAPELCLALEDTALGVEAAKKAGMFCIAIPNEFTAGQDFSQADAVSDSAARISAMLQFIK